MFRLLLIFTVCLKIYAKEVILEQGLILQEGNETKIRFNCEENNLLPIVKRFLPLEKEIHVNSLEISQCLLPSTSLLESLNQLNVNTKNLKKLKLVYRKSELLPRGNFSNTLTNINIEKLELVADFHYDTFFTDIFEDLVRPLSNLKELSARQIILPSLPKTKLINLTLSAAWVQKWDNCLFLEELNIAKMVMDYNIHVPNNWSIKCPKLVSLRLFWITEKNTYYIIHDGTKKSWKNLRSLTMVECLLFKIPEEILREAKGLEYLDLSYNLINHFIVLQLPVFHNLTYLNLAANLLPYAVNFIEFLMKLPALRHLILDDNDLTCSDGLSRRLFDNNVTKYMKSLERLSLRNSPNFPVGDCLQRVRFSNLKYLDMSIKYSIHSEYISIPDLPQSDASYLELDLRGRDLDLFFSTDFKRDLRSGSKEDYKYTGNNLNLLMDDIDCDCNHYWLAKALREFPNFTSIPKFTTLSCKNGNLVKEEPLRNLNCTKMIQENKITIREWTDSVSLEWHDDNYFDWIDIKTEVEYLPTLEILNVSSNVIFDIRNAYIPDSIKILDLRNNEIPYLNRNESALLFANPERKIWLSGNRFVCDCALIKVLHKHSHQVPDFNSLICMDSGKFLHSVTPLQTCIVEYLVIPSGILLGIFMIFTFLVWRFRLNIRVYLYSHSWCIYCVSEEELDSDKPYDAFLSYAHGDEDYVTEQLLPKLESEPYCYKICIHYRDWIVGEPIPAQIIRSVNLSKRVIIVLSRKFVQSLWGTLEFRYAMGVAKKGRRIQLIVLVLDDVLSDALLLEPELQGYLSLNTYMRCDDPWFWERLFYAMPHQSHLSNVVVSNSQLNAEIQMLEIQNGHHLSND